MQLVSIVSKAYLYTTKDNEIRISS